MELFCSELRAPRFLEQELLLLVGHAVDAGLAVQLPEDEGGRLLVPPGYLGTGLLLVSSLDRRRGGVLERIERDDLIVRGVGVGYLNGVTGGVRRRLGVGGR